jgi:hypothetical protein
MAKVFNIFIETGTTLASVVLVHAIYMPTGVGTNPTSVSENDE